MQDKRISQLDPDNSLSGSERVPVFDPASPTQTLSATIDQIKEHATGDLEAAVTALETEVDGKLDSIIAGTNVTIDNTDPNNPVISASGGGGSGDITGPETSTDNAITRWDGTDGSAVQDSGITVSDTDTVTIPKDSGLRWTDGSIEVMQTTAHGGQAIHFGGTDNFKELTFPEGFALEANTGNDASGTYEPYFDMRVDGGVLIKNTTQGDAENRVYTVEMTSGQKLKTDGNAYGAVTKADNISTSDKTFQYPNESGTLALEGNVQKAIFITVGASNADYITDGTADDVQIQQAIDALPSDGGTVFIKAGTYSLLNKLDFGTTTPRKVHIMGAGMGKTILQASGSFADFALFYDFQTGINGTEISGITFDANSVNGKGCIEIGTCTNVNIHDCEFKNVASPTTSHWTVLIGRINDSDIPGSASYNVRFTNNYIHDNDNGTNETILPVNCRDSRFDSNFYDNNDNTAFTLNLFGYCNNSSVQNNIFRNSRSNVYILSCDNVTVQGNTAYAAATDQDFCVVSNCQNTDVKNNRLRGFRSGGVACNGIAVLDRASAFDGHAQQFAYSTNVTIEGNDLYEVYFGIRVNTSSGMFDKYTARNITIKKNSIHSAEWQPILVGRNDATVDIDGVVIEDNYIAESNQFDTGSIAVVGYASDPTLVKATIKGNRVKPSSRANAAGVTVNAATAIVVGNDLAGTGKGTLAGQDIHIQNSGVLLAVGQNYHHLDPQTSKSANYTASLVDSYIMVNASGASRTITLPSVTGVTSKVMTVKKTDSSSNTVIVDGSGSETIDGGTTATIARQFESLTLVSDGSNWHIV